MKKETSEEQRVRLDQETLDALERAEYEVHKIMAKTMVELAENGYTSEEMQDKWDVGYYFFGEYRERMQELRTKLNINNES